MVFSSAIFLFGFLPLLLGLYFLAKDKFKNYIYNKYMRKVVTCRGPIKEGFGFN